MSDIGRTTGRCLVAVKIPCEVLQTEPNQTKAFRMEGWTHTHISILAGVNNFLRMWPTPLWTSGSERGEWVVCVCVCVFVVCVRARVCVVRVCVVCVRVRVCVAQGETGHYGICC